MSALRETLAGTASRKGHLSVRLRHFRDAGGWGIFCECGERISDANEDGDGMILSQIEPEQYALWHAHLESVVLAWVGARLAGASADVLDALDDERSWNPSGVSSAADAALTVLRDALGVTAQADMRPGATETAPGASNPGSGVSQDPQAEFDRSNEVEAATCPACPFLGCDGCEAEAARRANGEAK